MEDMDISQQQPRYLSEEKTRDIHTSLASQDTIYKMTDIFKVLSDPTRLKIVLALEGNELCVGDLAIVTGLSQSSVSHHLKTLRQLNLARFRRQGKMTFYSLADSHVSALVAVARDHARESTG